ncbi:MAG: ROK family protein [Armatimonadetes bacterium]|nr:ROK family protein [Armatimonadota bacterium]
MLLVPPRVKPPLDDNFRPAALSVRAYGELAGRVEGSPLRLAIVRREMTSVFDARVAAAPASTETETEGFVERLAKSLLWAWGGSRLVVGGLPHIGEYLARQYARGGPRSFDAEVMQTIYGQPFVVETCSVDAVPTAKVPSLPLGGHLDGCRIGLDLGGTDRKVVALRDGEVIYAEEMPWDPKPQADPNYHYVHIEEALRAASKHLPRVDAIGISAAGVYHDNRVRLASLFRGVPRDVFEAKVADIFIELAAHWDVPLAVANDGDVAALAGSMSLGVKAILGLAMGTSLAAGYVDEAGNITGWLNELGSVPIDWRRDAPAERWSGDAGTGGEYLSQDAVVRLAKVAGLSSETAMAPADHLKMVQELVEDGDPRAIAVMESVGCYLGYSIAFFANFYPARHVLLLGRVMSGKGGTVILGKAREVLADEFPDLHHRLSLHLPDEWTRRLGQAVAAASLPVVK